MRISLVEIKNFRNLSSVMIQPKTGVSIFYGENGSGKTSFLEAIYYLFRGQARSRNLLNIISHGRDGFIIHCMLKAHGGDNIPIGVERKIDGFNSLRVGSKDVNNQAEILSILPIQLINPGAYLLLESTETRRKYLDWGLFHVEPKFISFWRQMKHIVQSRNALLKSRSLEQIPLWNDRLVEVSVFLHKTREKYIKDLQEVFSKIIADQLPNRNIVIKYEPGWDIDQSLLVLLEEKLNRDLVFGYTVNGPHRADLKFYDGDKLAFDVLSRGQQKVLVVSLLLAQGLLLFQQTGKHCLYLVDDLPSELDITHMSGVVKLLTKMEAQTFITTIDAEHLLQCFKNDKAEEPGLFHVEQGVVTEIAL